MEKTNLRCLVNCRAIFPRRNVKDIKGHIKKYLNLHKYFIFDSSMWNSSDAKTLTFMIVSHEMITSKDVGCPMIEMQLNKNNREPWWHLFYMHLVCRRNLNKLINSGFDIWASIDAKIKTMPQKWFYSTSELKAVAASASHQVHSRKNTRDNPVIKKCKKRFQTTFRPKDVHHCKCKSARRYQNYNF